MRLKDFPLKTQKPAPLLERLWLYFQVWRGVVKTHTEPSHHLLGLHMYTLTKTFAIVTLDGRDTYVLLENKLERCHDPNILAQAGLDPYPGRW